MTRIMKHSRFKMIVEDANVNYEGSLTLPKGAMKIWDVLPDEQVHVLDVTNGERLITYAIEGDRVCINGAAAKKINVGDEIIIITYHNE